MKFFVLSLLYRLPLQGKKICLFFELSKCPLGQLSKGKGTSVQSSYQRNYRALQGDDMLLGTITPTSIILNSIFC